MGTRTVVPFGPQHPVLPEPIHLDLVLDDERVVEAIPQIGFIHRGLEKLVEIRDFQQFVYTAERICGICSFIHGLTYCLGIERLMGIEVPRRASRLRVVWSELSRLQSHLLWAGLMADAIGFESLFMEAWRIRERVLDIIEETTGGRIIYGVCKVGGLRRGIEPDLLNRIVASLAILEREISAIELVFARDKSVALRLRGVGVFSREVARVLGAGGPPARASNHGEDMRLLPYCSYADLAFEPVVASEGDSLARCLVRFAEMHVSIGLIRRAADAMPSGPVDVKVTGTPRGEYFSRTEQPRGEVVYYMKANGTKNLERLRVRTPTFANLGVLIATLKGSRLADVPVLIHTIDPCVSCTER
jgi:ech hydrogenase subunit E